MELIDRAGNAVRLSGQVGRRGGEGCVFHVLSNPDTVAKIFHDPVSPDKAAKLLHMIGVTKNGVSSMSAWPKSPLWNKQRALVGFTMPLVSGSEIHELYNPKERLKNFPGIHWNHLVRVARNCAAAFDEIHKIGAVIGDVNEGNILVREDRTVFLIDCDSYQISAAGKTWTCDVGVPIWTAPELQNKNFRGLHRTTNSDLFALALLIFRLLFMGRHPFAGIPLTSGEFLIEKGIAEFRFAFAKDSRALLVKPPPNSFPVWDFPEPLRGMFDRAFLRGSDRIGARPSARDWAVALDSLESKLRYCSNDKSHVFPNPFPSCPWCMLAVSGGVTFFFSVALSSHEQFDLNIWPAIRALTQMSLVAEKYSGFAPIQCQPAPLPPPVTSNRVEYIVGIILLPFALLSFWFSVALGFGLLCFALAFLIRGPIKTSFRPIRKARVKAMNEARAETASQIERLLAVERNYQQAFRVRKQDLDLNHQQLKDIETQRKLELTELEKQKRQVLLDTHLDSFLIAGANISGVGPKRKQALIAYGIQSALDVPNCRNVPLIGDVYYDKLMNWRRQCSNTFRFDPKQSIPRTEIQKVELKFVHRRRDLEFEARKELAQVQSLNATFAAGRDLIESEVQKLITRYSQAKADLEATPKA